MSILRASQVSYDIKASEYFGIYPPLFTYPTNGTVISNIETTLFTLQCQATDSATTRRWP